MKISFKPIVIAGNKRKDGTWAVSIRVTFKGVSRRLPTPLVCTASDLTRSYKIKSSTILAATERLVTQMRDAASTISPFDLELMDVDDVLARLRSTLAKPSFRLDFFQWADEYISTKPKEGTRCGYHTAVSALRRFVGGENLDINDINFAFLQDFLKFVKEEPKIVVKNNMRMATSVRKISGPLYLRRLAEIFNAAKDRYNDEDSGFIPIPRSPFSKLRVGRIVCAGQEPLPDDLMQRLILARSADPRQDLALAAFVLSFITMGANLADLWQAKSIRDGVWKYNRKKTADRREDHAEMRVFLQPEMESYIRRLGGGSGGEWWLPALHQFDAQVVTYRVNYGLRCWCEDNGVPRFTFYAARHTFATLARRLKVEKATVDEALAHKGDFDIADIYAQRAWDVINAANRVAIGHFRWPSTDGASALEDIVDQG